MPYYLDCPAHVPLPFILEPQGPWLGHTFSEASETTLALLGYKPDEIVENQNVFVNGTNNDYIFSTFIDQYYTGNYPYDGGPNGTRLRFHAFAFDQLRNDKAMSGKLRVSTESDPTEKTIDFPASTTEMESFLKNNFDAVFSTPFFYKIWPATLKIHFIDLNWSY